MDKLDKLDKKYFHCYTIGNNNNNNDAFVPLLATHSLHDKNDNITHAIIAIHGLNEDIFGTYLNIISAMGNRTNTVIVVPWFHKTAVSDTEWCQNRNISTSMIWYRNDTWTIGGDSERYVSQANPNNFSRTSSFLVLDTLFGDLTQRNTFPSMQRVVFSGFSAGGQMINRYSWASTIGSSLGDKSSEQLSVNVKVRFIVSDGSSYLYLSPFRPSPSCRTMEDTGRLHECDNFTYYDTIHSYTKRYLSSGDSPVVAGINRARDINSPDESLLGPIIALTSCNEFDQWKYGTPMTGLKGEGYSYLQRFIEDPELVTVHNTVFRYKDVRYVFGEYDSCNCHEEGYANPSHCLHTVPTTATSPTTTSTTTTSTKSPASMVCTPSLYDTAVSTCCDTYPDSNNNDLSTSCGAMLQGSNRLQRGLNYMAHLRDHFQSHSNITSSKHSDSASIESHFMRGWTKMPVNQNGIDEELLFPMYAVVPLLQHDSETFYKSDVMQRWVFQWDNSSVTLHNNNTTTKIIGHGESEGGDVGTFILVMIAGTLLLHFLYTTIQYFCSHCSNWSCCSCLSGRSGSVGEDLLLSGVSSAGRRRQISSVEPNESTHLL